MEDVCYEGEEVNGSISGILGIKYFLSFCINLSFLEDKVD